MDEHAIISPNSDLMIRLHLHGTFSCFSTRMPTPDEIIDPASQVVVITPEGDSWNPQCTSYKLNKETHIYYHGNLTQPHHRIPHLIENTDTHLDSVRAMTEEVKVPSDFFPEESDLIDNIIPSTTCFAHLERALWDQLLYYQDETRIRLSAIDDDLDPVSYSQAIRNIADETDFARSMGLAHELLSKTDSDQLFVMKPLTPLSVHNINAGRKTGVKASHPSKIWGIDIETARRTLEVTTQLRQQDTGSLSQNFSTNDLMLRYKQINCAFFTDTYFVTGKAKSTRGNTMMQLFFSEKDFVYIVPMESREEIHLTLKMFANEIGVTLYLILDSSGEQNSDKVTKMCHKMGTTLNKPKESTQNANLDERYVGITSTLIRKDLRKSDVPVVFWDLCAEFWIRINNLTACPLFHIQGQIPHLDTFGEEGDISNVCKFKCYDWAYAMYVADKFPHQAQ